MTSIPKHKLFTSTREDIRKNEISKIILDEIVKSLKSDDELRIINEEAKNSILQNKDEGNEQQMKLEVAKLLRFYGYDATVDLGGIKSADITEVSNAIPSSQRSPKLISKKIDLHDPPTFVKILNQSPVEFYPEQRKYIRIETDAMSTYHDSENIKNSKFNVIVNGNGLKFAGTTPLIDGRMRILLDCDNDASKGKSGDVTIELHRFGIPSITDSMKYLIVDKPLVKPQRKQIAVPSIRRVPVNGIEDINWSSQGWPDDVNKVASSSVLSNGELVVYYSTVFPAYKQNYDRISKNNPIAASHFIRQYELQMVIHSLLLTDKKKAAIDPDEFEAWEQQERCRVAIIACMNAEKIISGMVVVPEI